MHLRKFLIKSSDFRYYISTVAGVLVMMSAQNAGALDLMQSYQLALQNDAVYHTSIAETEARREALPQALAQLLPSISGSLSYSQNGTDSTFLGAGGRTSSRFINYKSTSYSLTLRQPLYRKYIYAQYIQAKFQVKSAEASLDSSLDDMMVRVSGAYLDALMAQDQMELVLSAKEAYAAQLKAAKYSLKMGEGTRTDIDDAQARYDMNLAHELEARQNIDYTRHELQAIIGQPVENMASLDPARMKLVSPMPADPKKWVVRGEEASSELRAMRANIEAAKQEVEKARAGHTPTIDLVVQRSRNDSANDQTINNLYLTTKVGVEASIPIFAGGQVNSQVRQASANLLKLQRSYDARRQEIGLKIRKEYQNVAQGILKIKALEQAERSVDQAVISNQKGFQAGMRTLIDILNAQQQRMSTLKDLSQARLMYTMARIRLKDLVGELNEEEIGIVNSWLTSTSAVHAKMDVLNK